MAGENDNKVAGALWSDGSALGGKNTTSTPAAPAAQGTQQAQQPMNFFTEFKKNVAGQKVAPQVDTQEKVIMAFGQALNEQTGRAADPNYVTPMVNGRHEISDNVLNAYATAGEQLPSNVAKLVSQLDTLAETSNALASMNPKIRARLQGQNGATNLTYIKSQENKIKRELADATRGVLTEEARLNLQNLRATAAATEISMEATARKNEADQILGNFTFEELVVKQATGEFQRDYQLSPSLVSAHIAARATENMTRQSAVSSRMSETVITMEGAAGAIGMDTDMLVNTLSMQLSADNMRDMIRMASSDENGNPITNQAGEVVVAVPGFGNVPAQVVETAILQQEARTGELVTKAQAAKGESISEEAVMSIVQRTGSMQTVALTQVDAFRTVMNELGYADLANQRHFQQITLAQDQLFQEMNAAYEAGGADDVTTALNEAQKRFDDKVSEVRSQLVEATIEEKRPAVRELLEGAGLSRESAEKAIGSEVGLRTLELDLAMNEPLSEVAGFASAISSSSLGETYAQQYAEANAEVMAGTRDADEVTPTGIAMFRDPVFRANAQKVFAGALQSRYYAGTIASQLMGAKEQLLASDVSAMTPEQAEAVTGQLAAIDESLVAWFGDTEVSPLSAEFSPEARALYNAEPVIGPDGEPVVGSNGQQVQTFAINPQQLIQNVSINQARLEAAGVTGIDLRDTFTQPVNEEFVTGFRTNSDGTRERVSPGLVDGMLPRGVAQSSMFRLMMDDGFQTDPATYASALIQSTHAQMRNSNRAYIQNSLAMEYEAEVTEDAIEAARARYVDEQMSALMAPEARRNPMIAGANPNANPSSVSRRNLQRLQQEAEKLTTSDLFRKGYLSYGASFDIFGDEIAQTINTPE